MTTTPYLGFDLPSPDAASQRADVARIATGLALLDAEALRRAGLLAVAGVPALLDLRLTDPMGLPPGMFSRLGTATWWDAAGVLRTAAAGTPRFDHDPASGRRRGLLIEPLGINLLVRAEELDHAAWSKAAVSVSPNQVKGPDGALTMDKIVEDGTTGAHRQSQGVSLTTGTTYCGSVFARAGERRALKLELSASGWSGSPRVTFNLASGSVQHVSGSPAYGIEDCGGGLYRPWIAAPATSTAGAMFMMLGASDTGEADAYAGNGAAGLFAWGAQVEAAPRPTSYMPSGAAQFTRAADVVALTDLAAWWPAAATIIIEATTYGEGGALLWLSDSSYSNRTHIARGSGGSAAAYVVVAAGNAQAALASAGGLWPAGVRTVLALACRTDDVALAAGGTLVGTDASATLPPVTALRLGADHAGVTALPCWVNRLMAVPRRVANTPLPLLTRG